MRMMMSLFSCRRSLVTSSCVLFLCILVRSQACPLQIWTFNSLDHCAEVSQSGGTLQPVSEGLIIADGTCRTTEVFSDSFSPSELSLLPGTYSATCRGSDNSDSAFGSVEMWQSGCLEPTCSRVLGNSPEGTCDRNLTSPSALYSRNRPPGVHLVQDISLQRTGYYDCYVLYGGGASAGLSVAFAIFGDCNCEPTTTATTTTTAPPPVTTTTTSTTTIATTTTTTTTQPPPTTTTTTTTTTTQPLPTTTTTTLPPSTTTTTTLPPPTTTTEPPPATTTTTTTEPPPPTTSTTAGTTDSAPSPATSATTATTEVPPSSTTTDVPPATTSATTPVSPTTGAPPTTEPPDNTTPATPPRPSLRPTPAPTKPVDSGETNPLPATKSESKSSLPAVAGGAVGGALIVALTAGVAWFFLVAKRKKKATSPPSTKAATNERPEEGTPPSTTFSSKSPQNASSQAPSRLFSEVVCASSDDISTLGEPWGLDGQNYLKSDESTASVPMSYIRNMMAQGGGFMHASETDMASKMESSAMSSATEIDPDKFMPPDGEDDEDSLEQVYQRPFAAPANRHNVVRFQVNVPPGRLGMLLDATDGIPTVNSIKPDSIFATRNVKVGDHLVAVDDVDVRGMAAMDVSQLIVMKSRQPRRLFTFERKRKAGDIEAATDDVAL